MRPGDSGLDIVFPKDVTIKSGETVRIKLGIACEPLEKSGYYLYPRSSISKTPLRLSNSVGIIDNSYRGELMVSVDNIKHDYTIKAGERLFQLCAPDLGPIEFTIVDELTETVRGEGGFGSTGK
jgi:dUTP pyrophosphatase